MSDHPDTGTRGAVVQPHALKKALATAADRSYLDEVENAEPTQEIDVLLEENRHLRAKLNQLEKAQKKTSRKYLQVKELAPYQAELIQLQRCLERRGKKLIVVFEGRGAAGKGGAIRRITQYMNAKHYRVVAMGKPSEEERSQWFYQRYIREFPRAGEMVLFDRSWYTRAIIERVFGFCTDQEYEDFIEGVSGFEQDLIRQDIILVKLYFSVSPQEQARRFDQRRDDPLQHWKLDEVDLDAEERRDDFTDAKYEMLRHTHTVHAPWTIIRSDIKHQARLNAMKVILSSVNYEKRDPTLDITPDPLVAVSGAYELERMEAHKLRHGKY
ncbi:MAG: polyphosphate kinase 2 [Sedimenticola sp.]